MDKFQRDFNATRTSASDCASEDPWPWLLFRFDEGLIEKHADIIDDDKMRVMARA
jgi:hypothetical protein